MATQDVALTFSFFDPDAGVYKTITSPAKKIQVAGQDIVDDQTRRRPARQGTREKRRRQLVAPTSGHGLSRARSSRWFRDPHSSIC